MLNDYTFGMKKQHRSSWCSDIIGDECLKVSQRDNYDLTRKIQSGNKRVHIQQAKTPFRMAIPYRAQPRLYDEILCSIQTRPQIIFTSVNRTSLIFV